MNRLVLRFGYPITAVILAIFAWVLARRIDVGWSDIVPLAVTAVVVWAIGAPAFILLWPRMVVGGLKRAILRHGFGGGPIPVNTLFAEPRTASDPTAVASLLGTGTDQVLYVAGWLDVRDRPRLLRVPDLAGRYWSVQLTDPVTGADFAYLGTRTTGGGPGEYVLTAPGWAGPLTPGLPRIEVPHRSALVLGRVFVAGADDQPVAFALARRLQLTSLPPGGTPRA